MRTVLARDGATRTPVALLIFNRPDLTAQVFAAVRAARPERLLVVADGPRNEAERARCEAARALIRVDWPCQLETNYSDANLGCKRRVASGIDWVFERCEEAIILEDDCLPSRSFFPYCDALLERYRHDERVMCISGMNLYPRHDTNDSYYFLRYGQTNGWASWRRAWQRFDVEMSDWPSVRRSGLLRDVFPTRAERWFWTALFDRQHAGLINTWDYQFLYARLMNGGLTAVPRVNTVINLGFRADATHETKMPKVWDPARTHSDQWELEHPRYVVPRSDVDQHYFTQVCNPLGVPGIALRRGRKLVDQAIGQALELARGLE